ncbi:MAG: intradiol ring-cleavage dioxygenase [Chloroflexi bacterium]|nr:intradiol ring-cleavage dioxygenase [Chloroflexota bacterium]
MLQPNRSAGSRVPPETIPTFEGRRLPDPTEPAWDQGLTFDVETLLTRRQALRILGVAGAGLTIVACGPAATGLLTASPGATAGATATAGPSATADSTTGAACDVAIPEETAGPYPGDGSNGPDVLSQSGVVRSDIRSSFGSSTTTAEGVPLTIRLVVLDLANGCAPYAGSAVYAWHCDRDGNYSMYSQAAAGENYLRGVQAAGDDGVVTFQSIFPACYSGRWPHIHFEVYPSLDAATSAANKIATSQIALPEDICTEVYATSGYESSIQTFSGVSLESDNVFADDGGARELGAMSGSIADGLTVELSVPVG